MESGMLSILGLKTKDSFMSETILEIKNLVVQFRTRRGVVEAVNGVDLVVKKGETIGLVGETGAGKTTTGLSILQLVPVPPGKIVSGSIVFGNTNLLALNDTEMQKIRGKQISMIFQDPMTALDPIMTVGDQISDVIKLHERLSPSQSRLKAMKMLEMVGISRERFSEYPHQFSGGMKQRVVIAIALACNPGLLIADEPTTALDVTIQAQVLEMMATLKKEMGTSLILITHDLGIVAEVCEKVAIMYAGKIIELGTTEDIFIHPCHPYTIGLFNSIPDIEENKTRLNPIEGLMPDPVNLPEGCAFAPRCEQMSSQCQTGLVKETILSNNHRIRCRLYETARQETK
jgi:peptide/nickel transport system ATP-binding protein